MTGEKNRAQNCLNVSNFKLDDVFSNVFGKSASAITTQLLEHPGEPFDVTPFVHGRCKTPIFQIQEAIDDIFTYEQAEKLKIIRSHMDSLEKHKAELLTGKKINLLWFARFLSIKTLRCFPGWGMLLFLALLPRHYLRNYTTFF